MKAIILAAGRGSRLGDITVAQPKPLTQLAGKPLLIWQLETLASAGITDVRLVCGYRSETLQDYGTERFINPIWDKSNMVRSLLSADRFLLEHESLVCYGDIVYRRDIIEALQRSSAPISITYDLDWLKLWAARFDDPLQDAESFRLSNGELITIGERVSDLSEIQGQYMGLLKFTPEGWQIIHDYLHSLTSEEVDKKDMTSLLRELLARGVPIAAVGVYGGWVEVDNPSDIAMYEQRIASDTSWHHDWRD